MIPLSYRNVGTTEQASMRAMSVRLYLITRKMPPC
jgi:hypothetical protein